METIMAESVYILCALMSITCAGLLFRGYHKTRSHLLLWSAVCFGLLALSNIVLFVDVIVLPKVDFHGLFWRNVIGAVAGSILLYSLIWELT